MNREILRLAVPNILSNISIPLLSTVDTILMGHLSASHLGAVGLGSMIFNFIYWNFGFLRMGTTGVTAQAYGAKDSHQISNTLYRAVLIALLLAVFILVIQWPLWQASSYLMNVDAKQYELVKTYFEIRLYAAPAALASYAIIGWFFGMQNAIYPLILTIFVNIVNIATSAYLVIEKGQGIEGVAIGTVVAQYSGIILAVFLIYLKYIGTLEKLRRSSIFIWEKIRRFLVINRDIFIRTVCLTFVFGFFYSQSSKSGEMFLAANVILLQFLNWMSYGVDGFAFASESLVGKYTGANDELKTNKAIRLSFYWGGVLALIYAIIYGFGGESLLHIFTDQQDVINYTKPYLFWVIILPIVGFACYIWDGVFIGLTASNAMRDSMLISLGFFLIIFYTIPWQNQATQLWMSLLLFLVARGIIQTWMYWKKGRNLR